MQNGAAGSCSGRIRAHYTRSRPPWALAFKLTLRAQRPCRDIPR
jgi:hypothetical protein